ncbi:MAG: hypothetical protein CMM93_04730 [Rickettsiales bacterium]|nr:hypothetical protein [Rickettsiales bacterium]
MQQINPELLNRTKHIITFAGRKVKCYPSTFTFNHITGKPVAECSAQILEGEAKGKQTTVVGLAARVACNK